MRQKMKVLVANGGFYPAKKYGGPVVSVDNLCTLLKEEIEFYILCVDHDMGETSRLEGIKAGWNIRNNCKVQYFHENDITKKNIELIVDEVKPDTIYLNSLFDAIWTIPLLQIAKQRSIRVLLAPRGQLCKNAFIRKYKKMPYIWYLRLFGLLENVRFQSTSDEETGTIKKYLGGTDNRIYFLTNLPSLPQYELKYHDKISGKGKFVFYSRIVPKKNLLGAIRYFNKVDGDVEFDIFGPIEDREYWEVCQTEIGKLPQNIRVTYKGAIEHDMVFNTLAEYDAFLFPTLSENFGHVISEALFSGCPVIISDQTPWRGLEQSGAGWDISLDKIELFSKAINEIVSISNNDEQKRRDSAKEFASKQFDLERIRNDYISALGVAF